MTHESKGKIHIWFIIHQTSAIFSLLCLLSLIPRLPSFYILHWISIKAICVTAHISPLPFADKISVQIIFNKNNKIPQ